MNWRSGMVEYPTNAWLKGGKWVSSKILGVGCRGWRPNLDTRHIDNISTCDTGGVSYRRRSISILGWWVFDWGWFGRRRGPVWQTRIASMSGWGLWGCYVSLCWDSQLMPCSHRGYDRFIGWVSSPVSPVDWVVMGTVSRWWWRWPIGCAPSYCYRSANFWGDWVLAKILGVRTPTSVLK